MNISKEQKMLQEVVAEAWANPTFKQELISNPISAIRELTGCEVQLPAGKKLAVFDQSDDDVICLNIPPQPSMDDVELTEEQLESVAGGGIVFPIIDLEKILTNSTISHPPE
jgi:hypothetical protein